MKIVITVCLIALIILNFNLASACKPAPPDNTNWLIYRVVIDKVTLPKGVICTVNENLIQLENKSGMDGSIKTPYGIERFPLETHIWELVDLKFSEGSTPTFREIKPQKTIPQKQDFEIVMTIKNKRHVVSGVILYERNSKYDPNALKKWKDPCGPGW